MPTLINSAVANQQMYISPIPISTRGTYELNESWTTLDRSQHSYDLTQFGTPVYDRQGVTLNGVDQYFNHSHSIGMMSITMWVQTSTILQNYLFEFSGDRSVSIANGIPVFSGGWNIPTYVIDGSLANNFISADTVHHLAFVDQVLHPVTSLKLGLIDSDKFYSGKMWKIRVYDRILILDDIEFLYDTEQ